MSESKHVEVLDSESAALATRAAETALSMAPSPLLALSQPEVDALPDPALMDGFATLKAMEEAAKSAKDRFRLRLLERVGEDGAATTPKSRDLSAENGATARVTYSQPKDKVDWGGVFADAAAAGVDPMMMGETVHSVRPEKVDELWSLLQEAGHDPSEWMVETVVPSETKIRAAMELGVVDRHLLTEHSVTPDPIPRLAKVTPSPQTGEKLAVLAEALATK